MPLTLRDSIQSLILYKMTMMLRLFSVWKKTEMLLELEVQPNGDISKEKS